MKKLKKPTVGMLMAILIFSNVQLYPTYGHEVKNIETQIAHQNKSSKENDTNEIINIPDINLKRALNEKLNKNEYEDITKAELESIEFLYILWGENVNSIEGLQYCTNLKYLRIIDNNISDISPISKLTNLERIEMMDNNISDISPISKLTNLRYIDFGSNNISDISPISKLTNL